MHYIHSKGHKSELKSNSNYLSNKYSLFLAIRHGMLADLWYSFLSMIQLKCNLMLMGYPTELF